MTFSQLGNASTRLEFSSPEAIIAWADQTFSPRLIATSSFQTQSLPLLHYISKIAPHTPILFADTGYHFPETLAFRDRIVQLLDLHLIIAKPAVPFDVGDLRAFPTSIQQADACCAANKIENVAAVMGHYDAWISGIRRDQTPERENTPMISFNQHFGIYKISPFLDWTREEILEFVKLHDLPHHPLWEQGYRSIGCVPCTRPASPGEADRLGRWGGLEKIECGMHEY